MSALKKIVVKIRPFSRRQFLLILYEYVPLYVNVLSVRQVMALVSMLLQFALNESKADGVFIRTLVPAAASAAVWLLLQG